MRIFLLLVLFAPVLLFGQSPQKLTVSFSHTADVGFGNEVFLLGDHPDLGGGVFARARKLTWSPGNIWRADVSIEANATVPYQFLVGSKDRSVWCDPASRTPLTGLLTQTAPPHEQGPYHGKSILYLSSWPQAEILSRDLHSGGGWIQTSMQNIGPGRVPGESTFRLDGLASSGGELEFLFTDGAGNYDNAPAPPQDPASGNAPSIPVPYQALVAPHNYRTSLDVFLVQDGNIYNYHPAAVVSPSSIQSQFISSSHTPTIASRNISVYLPRGYPEHPSKRYPTLYMHDGENVFFPGGSFGTWDADRIANHEIAMGRMRECIIVAVQSGGASRIEELTPPEDQVVTDPTKMGKADRYLAFLLDDVKPWVDANFRTRSLHQNQPVPAQTFVLGSSMGGLVSDYITLTRPDIFGSGGIMSAAYWTAPNHVTLRDAAAKIDRRLYLSIGTAEGDVSFWNDTQQAYNAWIDDGHVLNTDLHWDVGCGAEHNETAWSDRMPDFYHFILDPWLEGNPLTEELYPPHLKLLEVNAGLTRFSIQTRRGRHYRLVRNPNLTGLWTPLQTLPTDGSVWQTQFVEDDTWSSTEAKLFWRIESSPIPK